ncbi:MAG: aldolase catalytic domain-containing protein [Candidatus Binatia bacterium]
MSKTTKQKPESEKGTKLTYRSEIKVLDCTIRDGGLMNDHRFSDEVVRAVYETCVAAGIDYMEFGYKNSKSQFPKERFGPWKHCDEEDLRRIVGDNDSELKLSAMADAEKSDYQEDILRSDESVLDLIRVATYIHQIPVAIDMINDAHDKGYEVTVNVMAVSTVNATDLDEGLRLLSATPVSTIYVVDSFGSFYSEEIQTLMKKYLKVCDDAGKQVGIHAHNNQQLAYANTIEAIVQGANRLDATIAGLGRGAGNCQLELLIGFLKNPSYRLRPILECIEQHIEPLRATMSWGFDLPYMLTGLMNQHPRAAMGYLDQPRDARKSIVDFYDSMLEQV